MLGGAQIVSRETMLGGAQIVSRETMLGGAKLVIDTTTRITVVYKRDQERSAARC